MSKQTNEHMVNSITGKGSVFIGDLEIKGMIRVDGDFIGSIVTDGKVVIGHAARCECSIRSKSAVIGGKIKGNVFVDDRLHVLSGAVIIGNIYAPHIVLEEGVCIHGTCKSSGRENATDEQKEFILLHGAMPQLPSVIVAQRSKIHGRLQSEIKR